MAEACAKEIVDYLCGFVINSKNEKISKKLWVKNSKNGIEYVWIHVENPYYLLNDSK